MLRKWEMLEFSPLCLTGGQMVAAARRGSPTAGNQKEESTPHPCRNDEMVSPEQH